MKQESSLEAFGSSNILRPLVTCKRKKTGQFYSEILFALLFPCLRRHLSFNEYISNNGMDPDQNQHVGPDLDPNCLTL